MDIEVAFAPCGAEVGNTRVSCLCRRKYDAGMVHV